MSLVLQTTIATLRHLQTLIQRSPLKAPLAHLFHTSPAPSAHPRSKMAALQPLKILSSTISILCTLPELQQWRASQANLHRTIALVPTMGALHDGHLSLIRAAAKTSHSVVVSIYLNPAQFGLTEDLASYPQTWQADMQLLAQLDQELAADGANLGKIAAVFAPTTEVMYPSGFPGQEVNSPGSFVTITPVGSLLEGAFRPTFFRGVATVCMKLFSAVQPHNVFFGQKDIQQTVVIKTMVRDFLLPINVTVVPTKREADGLALSSRNIYLGTRRRSEATILYKALSATKKIIDIAFDADRSVKRSEVLAAANRVLEGKLAEQTALPKTERVLFKLDYFSVADPVTMEEVETVDKKKGAILSMAVWFPVLEEMKQGEDVGHKGGPAVRLIDNIVVPRRE